MNFCPECNFMVYTKLVKETQDLRNYCKNCSWEGEYIKNDEESICVFKKKYSNDFLAEKSYTNKYTIYDPTLPRVSNIPCVNDKCLTNQDFNELKTLCFENVMEDFNLKEFIDSKGIGEELYKIIQINQDEMLVEFDETMDVLNIFSDELNKINIVGEKSTIKQYIKPNREIIFIKYDNLNMKYLYLCSTCQTSWKN